MGTFDKYRRPGPRPGPAFAWSHPAHALALFFGVGCLRPAPGTWGSLAAALAWAVLVQLLPLWVMGVLTILLFFGGIAACGRTGRDLGVHDAGCIVVDEAAAVWLLCLVLPQGPVSWAAAFCAFRVFDIVKLPPASWADTKMANGFGVMLDDLFAAVWALGILEALDWAAVKCGFTFLGIFE